MIVRYRFKWRWPAHRVVAIPILCVLTAPIFVADGFAGPAGDEGFASRHPRLLFSTAELPLLRARAHDGGADDNAYAFIRARATDVYLFAPMDSLVREDGSLEPMINMVLASHLEDPIDTDVVDLGREVTLHIARTWDVTNDAWLAALRLRSLCLGFDHFFVNATAAERTEIRNEVQSYVSYMTGNMNYDIWRHRPYVSNKTAMIAASLGLAGICFQDEIPSALTGAALTAAHELYQIWSDNHLANDGCYREGSLYATWSMRNLVYYFAARKRFDGYNYALHPAIQALEQWLVYELDPRGEGRVNNIQDQTDYFRPLARHSTYWSWAQSEWGSGIAAYMWEHSAGPLGKDMLDENDKASTVLWHTGVTPVNPGSVLPRSRVWEDRGLYYYRSGWQDGASSGDVVFSFYSGEFRGGHAQEDQNQFTLAAYGEKLILDHGAGSQAKQTEAHNLIRIDGSGQHNAGNSIGTDGRIAAHITSDFGDCVSGDATLAYSTHSPYNNAGVPYPWSNWSWGLNGANPVEHAVRHVVSVHGPGTPPYFLIRDDVDKDGNPHQYDWCAHVSASSTVDTSSDPIRVTTGGASLYAYAVYPPRSSLGVSVTNFDNGNEDPNTRLLTVRKTAVNPNFTMLLLPLPASATLPEITRTEVTGGANLKLGWSNGLIDEIVARAPVLMGQLQVLDPFPWAVDSDAPVAMIRKDGPQVIAYVLVEGTWLKVAGDLLAAVEDGPASLVFDGSNVHASRADAAFRVRADAVGGVYFHGVELPSHTDGEFLLPGAPTGVSAARAPGLQVRCFPNPFNPSVQIAFVNPARGRVDGVIHDASGRLVKTLISGSMVAGEQILHWDGRDDRARPVASGVYFLKLQTGAQSATSKLVLLR